ncbi:MAG: membrane protein insertase YidC, partial [Pseudomonadota bacterium]
IFRRTISVDEDYLFNIEQSVENLGDAAVQAAPYGIIAQHGRPARLENFFIAHEGVIGQLTDELLIKKYNALEDLELDPVLRTNGETYADVQGGWVGLTDKYFMSTLVPPATQQFDVDVLFQPRSEIYQVRTRYPAVQVAPGATVSAASQMFAGAKEWELIRTYQDEGGIRKFIDSIDWGWFYFLTKPIFAVLHWLNLLLGNMGWAILGLTLLIKALLFPLAYKSYVSMAKMKELQPEMEKIKERVGDDRQKMQQEMMALYKDKKVNPAAGCLPILLQIPIFFSLYKVIFVTLELRHAPWLGPFQDLSAPDPTSFLNLFGLLPFGGPEPGSIVGLIFIGILPLLLGISMWLQQKLNPAPTDPTQAAVFAWMPWIFMFMLGGFASGLVIYWIANNVITFAQQYIIMRSNGYKPDLLGNITSSFKRKDTEAK